MLWDNYDGADFNARKKLGKVLLAMPLVIFGVLVLSQMIIQEWVAYDLATVSGGKLNDMELGFLAEINGTTTYDFQCINNSPFHIKLYYETDSNIILINPESSIIEKGTQKHLTIRINNISGNQQVVRIQVSGGMVLN